jgi:hypothetical protein
MVAALQSAAFGVIKLVYEEGPNAGQPFYPPDRLIWDVFDWDVGTLYNPQTGPAGYQGLPELVPIPGGPIDTGGVQVLDALQTAGPVNPGPGTDYPGTEDTWGVARVRNITSGDGWTVWSETGKDQTLTIFFKGEQDIHIEPILDQAGNWTGEDRISGVGFEMEIWSQTPAAGIDPEQGGLGPNARVGNFYPTCTVGTLELTLTSLPGFINPSNVGAGLASEFESRFDFTQLRGDGEAWMEITGGASQANFDFDPFAMNAANAATLGPLGFDLTADMSVRFDTSPYVGTSGWLVTSHDPLECEGFWIPEPLTMLGMFMGLGGVGAYIRKRRMV